MYLFSVIFIFSEILKSFPCTENYKKQKNTNATPHEYNKGKGIKNIHFILRNLIRRKNPNGKHLISDNFNEFISDIKRTGTER